jgi:hypothetical protein
MSGIINKTGARSGVVGTIVGTPPTGASSTAPTFTNSIKITPQATEPVAAGSNAGLIWMDSDDNIMRYSDGTRYKAITPALLLSGSNEAVLETTHGIYGVITFVSSSFITIFRELTVSVLVVGAGGGGGGGGDAAGGQGPFGGGGGGAGAFIENASVSLVPGQYTVVIGAGGSGAAAAVANGGRNGINGGDTTFAVGSGIAILANGGGGGGSGSSQTGLANGNSSGGGGAGGIGYGGAGGTGGTYGNNGGTGAYYAYGGRGGGGATAAGTGSNGSNHAGGPGGAGDTNDYRTGSNITYSVGGAGLYSGTIVDGGAGTGIGGTGGNNSVQDQAGDGGSGIVVMRYVA